MKNFRLTIVYLFLVVLVPVCAIAQTRQTREEYIEKYKAIAVAHMERYGIPASITMAQGILESDAGNSKLSLSSNNHFGIRCKKHWTGAKVYHDDDAKGECFRAYDSVEDSYQDHAEFLDSSPRYDSLFAYPSNDYRSWARGLKAAGYATAPDYAQRLVAIIEKYKLYILDQQDGAAIYSSGKNAKENAEWFALNSNQQRSDVKGEDIFNVTINAHNGYKIYRVNKTCYVVAKQDDTYDSIGKVFGITARMLRKFNDADEKDSLKAGDWVYIERKKSYWLGVSHQYTVEQEQSLRDVAQKYGIRSARLARINRINKRRALTAGQSLQLK